MPRILEQLPLFFSKLDRLRLLNLLSIHDLKSESLFSYVLELFLDIFDSFKKGVRPSFEENMAEIILGVVLSLL
jgi:hypothetical protein